MVRRVEALISEDAINQIVLDTIYETVHKNKGKRFAFVTRKETVPTRLSTSAVDLLLAEHYLEEDVEFYQIISAILTLIHSVNHNLTRWTYESSKGVESWFIDKEHLLRKSFQQYRERLNSAHQKILSSI
jgi:hypothetical protein